MSAQPEDSAGTPKRRRPIVRAAGVVALKRTSSRQDAGADDTAAVKVMLVHRPQYNDWVLPKGHVDPGESMPETASREFLEETGRTAVLMAPLATISYPVADTIKRVHWFLGTVPAQKARPVLDPAEIDRVAWKHVDKALELLSYDDEKDVLRQAVNASPTCQLMIVRHAKALGRKGWRKDDWLRPLAARGRRQAHRLAQLLGAYGVGDLVSSPSTRCHQTLQPYAGVAKLPIEQVSALSEEGALDDADGVAETMLQVCNKLLRTGVAAAVCGHRPVLPAMVEAIGVTGYQALKPGEVLVLHLDAKTGQVSASERLPSKL